MVKPVSKACLRPHCPANGGIAPRLKIFKLIPLRAGLRFFACPAAALAKADRPAPPAASSGFSTCTEP